MEFEKFILLFLTICATFVLILTICATFVLIFSAIVVFGNAINTTQCISIPDDKMVDNFCQDLGYRYGWLDSGDCDKNQVKCFKEIGIAKYYICEDWKEVIQ